MNTSYNIPAINVDHVRQAYADRLEKIQRATSAALIQRQYIKAVRLCIRHRITTAKAYRLEIEIESAKNYIER